MGASDADGAPDPGDMDSPRCQAPVSNNIIGLDVSSIYDLFMGFCPGHDDMRWETGSIR